MELTREIAATTSPDKPLYDAALDNFEKGMTAERIDEVCLQLPYLSPHGNSDLSIHAVSLAASWCDVLRLLDPASSELASVTDSSLHNSDGSSGPI